MIGAYNFSQSNCIEPRRVHMRTLEIGLHKGAPTWTYQPKVLHILLPKNDAR